MSVEAGFQPDALASATYSASQDAQSDLGDGSSSLSDIEDKEADQDELDDIDLDQDQDQEDENDIGKDDENDVDMDSDANDSEAETERLENSPHTSRRHKDVVLTSRAESQTYERSPSKLYQSQSYAVNDEADDEDVDDLTDEEGSGDDSSARDTNAVRNENLASAPSFKGSDDTVASLAIPDSFNKKRKRSLLPERRSPDPDELDEPARKRTGSILGHGDDFAVDDTASGHDDNATSNAISGELSEVDSDADEDEIRVDIQLADGIDKDGTTNSLKLPPTPDGTTTIKLERHRRSRSRKSIGADGTGTGLEHRDDDDVPADNAQDVVVEDEDENDAEVENEADEAEAVLKNEEEQEKKRVSLDLLSNIQKQFDAFKKTLYDERMAQLEREEALLKADPPTHPQYLEMMKCIDARRDDKLRVEANTTKYKFESMQRTAVATRSQILAQFSQEVREIREKVLEKTGKMWYEIQNDRRGYGYQVEEYAIRFPTKRSQQVMHHNQYTKEVSLLSGIAKHVGFPAAPKMNGASQDELASDLEKMGKPTQQRQVSHRSQTGLPDLAALRAATSTSSFRPAEEQFIEQTPWANPQHPSHAHLIHRQTNGHHAVRTGSPFGMGLGVRKHTNGPPLGIFSGGGTHTSNNPPALGGRVSPGHAVGSALQPKGTPQFRNARQSRSPDLETAEDRMKLVKAPKSSEHGTMPTATIMPFHVDIGDPIKREEHTALNGRFS